MNAEIVKIFDMLKRNIIDTDEAQALVDTMFANVESDGEMNAADGTELPWPDDGKIHIVAYLGREMLTNAEVKDKTSDITISLDYEPKGVESHCGNLHCSTVTGNVYGYNGEITVGSIMGNIQSEKAVTVNGDVNGDVSAVGTVKVARDINGSVKGHVIVRGPSSDAKTEEGMSANFKDLGKSISDMLNTSFVYASDAINDANEALKKKTSAKKKEESAEHSERVTYTDISDITDDSIRIGVIKGNRIINTLDMAERFTVELSDFEPCDLYCSGNVVCDCVSGGIRAGGNVTCDCVGGDICSAGTVNCADVGGDIHDCGDVNCDSVSGDIRDCGDVDCDSVDGSVSDCDTVTCDEINGDINDCQTVKCDEINGDMYNCNVNKG